MMIEKEEDWFGVYGLLMRMRMRFNHSEDGVMMRQSLKGVRMVMVKG